MQRYIALNEVVMNCIGEPLSAELVINFLLQAIQVAFVHRLRAA